MFSFSCPNRGRVAERLALLLSSKVLTMSLAFACNNLGKLLKCSFVLKIHANAIACIFRIFSFGGSHRKTVDNSLPSSAKENIKRAVIE